MERIVKPEMLDSLEASDPAAIRSRKDLRLINWFMRGESWIISRLKNIEPFEKVIELGAGDGCLVEKIHEQFPSAQVVAIDLLDKPKHVSEEIVWEKGDVLESDAFTSDAIVVANLFIHHLDAGELYTLGERLRPCQALIIAEPHRYWLSKCLGYLLFPVVNHVTRHDMMVSITAGFRFGELDGFLGMDRYWEEFAALGGIRAIASKTKSS